MTEAYNYNDGGKQTRVGSGCSIFQVQTAMEGKESDAEERKWRGAGWPTFLGEAIPGPGTPGSAAEGESAAGWHPRARSRAPARAPAAAQPRAPLRGVARCRGAPWPPHLRAPRRIALPPNVAAARIHIRHASRRAWPATLRSRRDGPPWSPPRAPRRASRARQAVRPAPAPRRAPRRAAPSGAADEANGGWAWRTRGSSGTGRPRGPAPLRRPRSAGRASPRPRSAPRAPHAAPRASRQPRAISRVVHSRRPATEGTLRAGRTWLRSAAPAGDGSADA